MAIDTARKRRSAGGVPFLPLGLGVTPNASKPVAWRQEAGWGYDGILPSGSPPVIDELPHFLPFFATMGQLKSF